MIPPKVIALLLLVTIPLAMCQFMGGGKDSRGGIYKTTFKRCMKNGMLDTESGCECAAEKMVALKQNDAMKGALDMKGGINAMNDRFQGIMFVELIVPCYKETDFYKNACMKNLSNEIGDAAQLDELCSCVNEDMKGRAQDLMKSLRGVTIYKDMRMTTEAGKKEATILTSAYRACGI